MEISEAILIDPENILLKLNELIDHQGGQKIPVFKKKLCYYLADYKYSEEKLIEIGERYWQIINFWSLPTVKKYFRKVFSNHFVNIPITTCPDNIKVSKHSDRRISTCVHYISFRQSGVYWYKPKYNIAVNLPQEKSDLAVMLKSKGTYTSDILADGLNLLGWEQENFTDNLIKAFDL